MVKVLLIGNGAREHVLAESLVRGGAELYAYMAKRNPGIVKLCEGRIKIGNLKEFATIGAYGQANHIDFAVVGPEAPLTMGITNALMAHNLPTIGPTIECAQLEGSKIFMRDLLKKYKIAANIQFQSFPTIDGIREFVDEIGKENVVVKPDGLTGGKGVKVWGDHLESEEEIYEYCNEIFAQNGHVIIEEKLEGEEFTYICFVDGTHVVGTPVVQDNKRAYNGDTGPNTGGMGSYSLETHLMPFISQADVDYARSQMEEVVAAIAKETGVSYKGFLYGQFMKTVKGLKIVEFNIRFGDPEAMNLLAVLKSNLVTICQDILAGTLTKPLEFERKATVCKYLVPEGYPVEPKAHAEIHVDEQALADLGVKLYYASVSEEEGKLFTSTSRAIGIVGVADSLEEAEQLAERGTTFVRGALFHRTDIGTRGVLDQRTKHMEDLLQS